MHFRLQMWRIYLQDTDMVGKKIHIPNMYINFVHEVSNSINYKK